MINFLLDGQDFLKMVEAGSKKLIIDIERINSLNVFPVPDGDTGTNMRMTIEGGIVEARKLDTKNIGEMSKQLAKNMVLNARGNSGVILSQFFKGISTGLKNVEVADINQFSNAFVEAYKRSYSVVQNPTEGTMLTVMREAADEANKTIDSNETLSEYLTNYLDAANTSLENTPNLLPVLKKAGVIDSGGAGLCRIIEGMLAYVNGEKIEDEALNECFKKKFGADSQLTLGYCTRFALQLQNSKVDVANFDLNVLKSFLNTIGDSVVIEKENSIVKVHLHTFDPGIALTECRKFGEYLSVKVDNIDVSGGKNHSIFEEVEIPEQEEKPHKPYAIVSVANGAGLAKAFMDMGVDEVVTGGQTMNTSTKDFIKAFDKINADRIFVFPNNSNIKMAAMQAAENYSNAEVVVVPTKTIAEGYSAISMLNVENRSSAEIVEEEKEIISNVKTLEVTYSIRDTQIGNLDIKKGNFICIYDGELISTDENRVEAVKKAFNTIADFDSKQVLTIFCGQDVPVDEVDVIKEFAETINPFIEVYPIQGDQNIYSFIIGIE